jgi:hypothetical protein
MTMTLDIPQYVSLPVHERGNSLNISFANYRLLARTCLRIIDGFSTTNAVYRLPKSRGGALDIFSDQKCLTIVIDSQEHDVSLWSCLLDSTESRCLVVCQDSEEDSWDELVEIARQELEYA